MEEVIKCFQQRTTSMDVPCTTETHELSNCETSDSSENSGHYVMIAANDDSKDSDSYRINGKLKNTTITYKKANNNPPHFAKNNNNNNNIKLNVNRTSLINLYHKYKSCQKSDEVLSPTSCSFLTSTSCSPETDQPTNNVFKQEQLPRNIVNQFLLKSSAKFLSGCDEKQQEQQLMKFADERVNATATKLTNLSDAATAVGISDLDFENLTSHLNTDAEEKINEEFDRTSLLSRSDKVMTRHRKWVKQQQQQPKRKSSLAYGFLRYSISDDCSRRAGAALVKACKNDDRGEDEGLAAAAAAKGDDGATGCQYNLRQTHFHCVRKNCVSVCANIRDLKWHAHSHKRIISKTITTNSAATAAAATTTTTVEMKSFRRYHAKDDCKASFCIYSGVKTAHFHCSRKNCQFTFHNKSDMAKHRTQHDQMESLSSFAATADLSVAANSQMDAASGALTVNASPPHINFSVTYLQRLWQQHQQQQLLWQQHRERLPPSGPDPDEFCRSLYMTSSTHPVQITSIDGFFNRKRGRPPKNRFVEVYKSAQETPQAIFTSFKLEKQQHLGQGDATIENTAVTLAALPSSTAAAAKTAAIRKQRQQLERLNQDMLPASPISSTQHQQRRPSVAKDCFLSSRYDNYNNSNNKNNNNNKYNIQQSHEFDCGIVACRVRKTRPHLHCGKCQHQVSPFDLVTHTCTHVPDSVSASNGSVQYDATKEAEVEKISVVRAAGTFYPENSGSGRSTVITAPTVAAQPLPLTWQQQKSTTQASYGIQVQEREEENEQRKFKSEDAAEAKEEERRPMALDELPQDLSVTAAAVAQLTDTSSSNDAVAATETKAAALRLPPHLAQVIKFYQQQQFLLYGHVAAAVAANALPPEANATNSSAPPSLLLNTVMHDVRFDMATFLEKFTAATAAAAVVASNNNVEGRQQTYQQQQQSQPHSLKNIAKRARWHASSSTSVSVLSRLRDERDRIPVGYLKYRFNEDCGFEHCGYRNHQSHFHCNRRDCHYSFCDKTRFVQHTARHERLDTIMGADFQQFRANMSCGYPHCAAAAATAMATTTTTASTDSLFSLPATKLKKSSHFHCLKCDFICANTNKVVAHRRLHSKLEYIRLAGFRKVDSNERCQNVEMSSTLPPPPSPPEILTSTGAPVLTDDFAGELPPMDAAATGSAVDCTYSMRHTHYHCLVCNYSILSRAQLATHKHK